MMLHLEQSTITIHAAAVMRILQSSSLLSSANIMSTGAHTDVLTKYSSAGYSVLMFDLRSQPRGDICSPLPYGKSRLTKFVSKLWQNPTNLSLRCFKHNMLQLYAPKSWPLACGTRSLKSILFIHHVPKYADEDRGSSISHQPHEPCRLLQSKPGQPVAQQRSGRPISRSQNA